LDSIAKINRKRRILELLEVKGTMSINELAEVLGISSGERRLILED